MYIHRKTLPASVRLLAPVTATLLSVPFLFIGSSRLLVALALTAYKVLLTAQGIATVPLGLGGSPGPAIGAR